MVQHTLQGTGVVGLSPGVSQLRTSVTVFPSGYSTGRAIPTNYYDVGLLRLGNQGSYYPPIALDATDTIIDVPSGVTSLGYSLFGAATAVATEVFLPVPTGQLEPWDRNLQLWHAGARFGMNGGTGTTDLFSYTVPANRILGIVSARLSLERFVQATTPSSAYIGFYLDGAEHLFVQSNANLMGPMADDWLNGGTLYCPPGTAVTCNCGNSDVGGNVGAYAYTSGYLFDSAD